VKYDADIGNAIAQILSQQYEQLPAGKPWIKYGKSRLYFNEKKEKIDYGFFIQFFSEDFKILDYMEDYWNDKLGCTLKEFEHAVDNAYYKATYPVSEKIPNATVREIKLHRRVEALIVGETEDHIEIDPQFLEITYRLDKTAIENQVSTPRKHRGKTLLRFTIYRERIDEIGDELQRLEDKADAAFMQQMQRGMGDTITVGESQIREDVQVEKTDEIKCSNCGKLFDSHQSEDQQFCSSVCKQEYQASRG
jgi:hypothetical protein